MRVTTPEERIGTGKLSKKGLADRRIVRHLGLSSFTIRKWRRLGKGNDKQRLFHKCPLLIRLCETPLQYDFIGINTHSCLSQLSYTRCKIGISNQSELLS